jgi:hypothetical protein
VGGGVLVDGCGRDVSALDFVLSALAKANMLKESTAKLQMSTSSSVSSWNEARTSINTARIVLLRSVSVPDTRLDSLAHLPSL